MYKVIPSIQKYYCKCYYNMPLKHKILQEKYISHNQHSKRALGPHERMCQSSVDNSLATPPTGSRSQRIRVNDCDILIWLHHIHEFTDA